MRRVVITGLGAVTPLGVGVQPTWNRLLAGNSGIVSIDSLEPRKRWKGLPSTVAGLVPENTGKPYEWQPSAWLGSGEQARLSRHTQFAIAAGAMAIQDSAWSPATPSDREMSGVSIGSGIGDLDQLNCTSLEYEDTGYRKISPQFVPKILLNMAASHVSMRFGLQGPVHCMTTACATGADSIGHAFTTIRLGRANVMIAGGTEACIHPLALAGFAKVRSLSTSFNETPHRSCRPFDRDRDGFVIAEGSTMLVLEDLEHATKRGARVYAEVRGWGSTGDAFHPTAPRVDGDGAWRAMKNALNEAGMTPQDVGYINAHATGTRVGDIAEVSAIKRLLEGYDETSITISSTKGATGHLLGAAGALEALFTVLSIYEGMVPPTLNLDNPDVGDANFNFVTGIAHKTDRLQVGLSNSFGFGGANTCLVFSRFE